PAAARRRRGCRPRVRRRALDPSCRWSPLRPQRQSGWLRRVWGECSGVAWHIRLRAENVPSYFDDLMRTAEARPTSVDLQHGQERFLRDLDFPHALHPPLSFLLLLQSLPLARALA